MPRNEFMTNHCHADWQGPCLAEDCPITGMSAPRMCPGVPGPQHPSHSGKSDDEVTDQEVDPIEDDPHMWPAETRHTLAELRKSGESTTAAHFAGPAT